MPDACKSSTKTAPAFTLVELLTVVFIISLLIGILLPSLTAARTAAKKAVSSKSLESVSVGLEMFRNENDSEFPQTNGYPPSFAHPPIGGAAFLPYNGEFPFWEGNPQVYGAHWLPAMLMGVDALGYVKRRSVPRAMREFPPQWYTPDPTLNQGKPLDRAPLYVNPGSLPMLKTIELPGRPNMVFFEDWDKNNEFGTQNLPVIVDGFDYPVLYYVANKHGRPTNMLEDRHLENNNYNNDADQQRGVPYFFHQDNEGFTGNAFSDDRDDPGRGWDFNGQHPISRSGAELDAAQLLEDENRNTFARYIVDRKLFYNLEAQTVPNPATPLRPVNADSYLLISPGADGRYGTNDDISNLPRWTN